jgi:hypothetical protein
MANPQRSPMMAVAARESARRGAPDNSARITADVVLVRSATISMGCETRRSRAFATGPFSTAIWVYPYHAHRRGSMEEGRRLGRRGLLAPRPGRLASCPPAGTTRQSSTLFRTQLALDRPLKRSPIPPCRSTRAAPAERTGPPEVALAGTYRRPRELLTGRIFPADETLDHVPHLVYGITGQPGGPGRWDRRGRAGPCQGDGVG